MAGTEAATEVGVAPAEVPSSGEATSGGAMEGVTEDINDLVDTTKTIY